MPAEQIEAATQQIPHEQHREHLRDRLQMLARASLLVEQNQESSANDLGNSEIYETYNTDVVTGHGNLTAQFFARASEELGSEATEDQVWDKVVEDQLTALQFGGSHERNNQVLAANLLVNNLLSVYGQSPEKAQATIDRRMWQVARYGAGVSVLAAAKSHEDLCVISSDPETPYHSIAEQTQKYGHLFFATSSELARNNQGVNVPVELLAEASLENKAWFFAQAIQKQNFPLVETNKRFIAEGEADEIARKALPHFRGTVEDFNAARLTEEPLTDKDFALAVIESSENPYYGSWIKFENMDAEAQNTVFAAIVDKFGERGASSAIWSLKFSELNADNFDKLADMGLFSEDSSLPIRSFKNLPTGTYDKLKEAGYSEYQLVEGLESLDIDDKKQIFQEFLEDSNQRHNIFGHPDKFDFVPRDELLELAREHKQLWTVSNNIQHWTDGSDKELIIELADATNSLVTIAYQVANLPALDRDWIAQEMIEREDYNALAIALKHIPDIDQQALFGQIIQSEKRDGILQYSLTNFNRLDTDEVLRQLVNVNSYEVIASNAGYFANQTSESLEKILTANPAGLLAIASNLYSFDTDRQWLAEALIANGELTTVASHMDDFVSKGVDLHWLYQNIRSDGEALGRFCSGFAFDEQRNAIGIDQLFTDIMATRNAAAVGSALRVFDKPEMHQAFLELCIAERDNEGLTYALDSVHLDPMDTVRQCIAGDWEFPIASRWNEKNLLADMDPADIPTTQQLLDMGAVGTLLTHPDRYPDTPRGQAWERLLQSQDEKMIAVSLLETKAGSVPFGAAEKLLGTEYAWAITQKRKQFDPASFTPEFIEAYLDSGNNGFAELYEYSEQHIDWIDKAIRDFGSDAPRELFYASRELNRNTDEPLPPEYTELGVITRDNVGVDRLRAVNTRIRSQLLDASPNPEGLAEFVRLTTTNSLARSIALKLTRFNSSEWGKHDDEAWVTTLQDHLATLPEHVPMRPEFTPSAQYSVRTIDAKEFDPSRIDEDARDRFTALQAELSAALSIARKPANGRYTGLFYQGQAALNKELERLATSRQKFIENGREKAIDGVDRRITEVTHLSQLSGREFVATFQNNFSRFSNLKIKELDSVLRTGIFARSIQRSPVARAAAEKITTAGVDFSSLSGMDNFVDHIVNQGVFGNYFPDQRSRKAFENLSDTAALRKQITKIQNGQTKGETKLQFIPSRGLALELSGHLGDACWASKYDSIAQQFPNITAITFVRNPGASSERLVGTALAIDTIDTKTGEPVTVIRGVNPIENYINGVKVADFMDALTDYGKKIAGDRKLAIVIDDKSGAAATNRPVLHEHLTQTYRAAHTTEAPIRLNRNSTFNGYILSPGAHPAYPIV